MKIFDPIPEHRTLSIMPTFRCTAECNHCGTMSNPRESTWLPLDEMLSAINQAAASGYEVAVFTGGEPTLAGKNLLAAISEAVSLGLVVRIVTNAHWAKSERSADYLVSKLVEAGLNEINFSTGDQHSRFVPIENILYATRASVKAGLRVSIMVETVKERTVTKEVIQSYPEFQQIIQDFQNAWIDIHESPWMPLSSSTVNEYPSDVVINESNLSSCRGCDSILTTTTVQANGNIGACCGLGMRLIPELQLGNIRETSLSQADQKAANDFLKRWIKIEGPEKIVAWTSTKNPEIKWENMYAHRCQACLRLYTDPKVRKIIAEHYQEKMIDVTFSEYLLHHYNLEQECSQNIK